MGKACPSTEPAAARPALSFPLKLAQLEPSFRRYEPRQETWRECAENHVHTPLCGREVTGARIYLPKVERIEDAQGVEFLCPKCFIANGGPEGTHIVLCWSSSRGVPDEAAPKPGRWRLVGTGLHDLSLMEEPGKSRSVLLLGGCGWHGFVTNGEVS